MEHCMCMGIGVFDDFFAQPFEEFQASMMYEDLLTG